MQPSKIKQTKHQKLMEALSPWDGREILDGEIQTEQHELHTHTHIEKKVCQKP